MASPTKSCELDPIPTSLLKKILPSISQLLTAIVNSSITLGTFPNTFQKSTSMTSTQKDTSGFGK